MPASWWQEGHPATKTLLQIPFIEHGMQKNRQVQSVLPHGQPHLPMTNRMVGNPAILQDGVPVFMRVLHPMLCGGTGEYFSMFQTAWGLQPGTLEQWQASLQKQWKHCIGERSMYGVYKKLDGHDQVLMWWARACRGINSYGRVVTMEGSGFSFQEDELIEVLMLRQWMNILCVCNSWSVNVYWPASVHVCLKWVGVWLCTISFCCSNCCLCTLIHGHDYSPTIRPLMPSSEFI